jgi:hypothetical protein
MFKRLIVLLVAISFTATSQAAMIPTPSERDGLLRILDRAEVQAQLQAYGLSVEQARSRVATLSDAEAAQLTAQIESLPAGGDVGAVLGLLVFVFLVLLITDILGFTKIFPFTKPIK